MSVSNSPVPPPIPLFLLPAPFPEENLPEPDNSRHFPVQKYWSISRNPDYAFDELDLSNDVLKKVVLSEIRNVPDIWCSRSFQAAQNNYPIVAVETFKRTGLLLSVPSIKSIYKCAKDNLRNRLRFAIVKKKMNPEQTEEYLWGWDYYPFIRYYREYLQKWENELLKEINDDVVEEKVEPKKRKIATDEVEEIGSISYEDSLDGQSQAIIEANNDDDDVIWEGPEVPKQSATIETAVVKPEEGQWEQQLIKQDSAPHFQSAHQWSMGQMAPQGYHMPGVVFRPPQPYVSYMPESPVQRQFTPNGNNDNDSNSVISISSSTRIAPPVNFEEDMSQISFQALRVVREQPDVVRMMRKALFDVVLAFDEKKFNGASDLFKHLHDKNTI